MPRRRWIAAEDAPVFVRTGRWGRRRVRVTECLFVAKAEELYTELLRNLEHPVRPGSRGHIALRGMSRALLKLSGSLVHDYATISDDSPSPNRASRARRAATSAGIS